MSDEIKIEKDVPLPSPRTGRAIYPFNEMEVGDSFFWGGKKSTITTAASWFGTRKGKKFTLRTVEGGTRVWRIT